MTATAMRGGGGYRALRRQRRGFALTALSLALWLAGCGGPNQADVASILGSGGVTPAAEPSPTSAPSALSGPTSASRISFQAGSQIELEMFDEAGRCIINVTDDIIALVGDYRGQAVPAGTPIAFFVASGRGIIQSQALTDDTGVAKATFRSLCPENAQDVIEIIAAVRGAEPFVDLNSNGRRDASEPFTDLESEAFLDANANGVYEPQLGEYMIWDPNHNGRFDAGGNGNYDTDAIIVASAVIIPTMKPTTPSPTPPLTPTPLPEPAFLQVALFVNEASDNLDGTLSSVITAQVSDAQGVALNNIPVMFRILPPLTGGVSVTSPSLSGADPVCTLSFTVSGQPGNALSCLKYDSALQGESVTVEASVDTASEPLVSVQTIVLPDLRAATPTPTNTATITATPTRTPTPTPAAAHIEVALFLNQASPNGDGTLTSVISALVTDATGAAVANGIPVQFSLQEPVPAGVSVTSPGLVGATAPCTLGSTVVAQPGDALSCVKYDMARQGQTVTVIVVVQTPSGPLVGSQTIVLPDLRTLTPTLTFTVTPTSTVTPTPSDTSTRTPTITATPTITPTPTIAAAHIQVALFVNQASPNGDGTLTSVISALVTDDNGAVVANGIPVQFSLLAPVLPGISVTSPGLIGQAAPCTIGFPVQTQPGDALSCVKYDSARQGQTVTVLATVQTASGPLSSSQTIVLPDLRTATSTPSASGTATATATMTATPTPPAAHIQVALFVNQASSNGDGTLSSVISALVTDANGAVVGNGVPVQFSIVAPVIAGVSVTSPGFVGQAAPCTLALTVVPQPGDALSCVKYDSARQGQTITVMAVVQTPSGPLSSSQTIVLPDLRTLTPTATFSVTPTPTPTVTLTPTLTLTPTQTPTPTPAAAHIQVALFVNQASSNGDGTLSSVISALVTDANGAVVGNGVPVQFSIVAPVLAGVSVTSPGFVGQAAPCTLALTVVPQPGDALSCVKYDSARQGQTITVMAVVQTPSGPLSSSQTIVLPDLRTLTPTATLSVTPTRTFTATLTPTLTLTPTQTATPTLAAAHIQVALFVNQASSNGDGTLSSVISALVTDANGAVVGNGVPVQFSIVAPVPAGVSVTSPGLVGQAAPCTLGFTVVAQPGDALSCVKYDSARQGQTITVMAVVQTPSGPLSSTQTIVLPDLRTLTPTVTFSSTPTLTLTPTPTRTQTGTPTLPAAHIQVALFVNQASSNGDGTLSSVISALVTDANGAVVGNGVPVQFSIVAPVPAGVSVTSPGLVGQAAPCTLGFTVVAQPGDALSCVKYDTARQGQTITVMAVVQTPSGPLSSTQTIVLPDLRTLTPTATSSSTPTPTRTQTATPTPPAAHIQVALFINQASANGDGTLSSVISALVTDANGAVVGNGVPVQFSIVAPVPAGVSVTSPGLVGQAAPCTLGFTVVAQPGDALSCVKYDTARQGQTITVMAVVQTPSGPLSSTQTIVLPDVRTLTPTATSSSTPTPTATRTPTATPPAAHIQVALFVNQASSNGDGTLSSVISALVTDANGAVVGNGVPVQFSIVAPVPAGVSVTSPGLVGQAAPCTLSFTVVAQPGDALSCVKYDTARQGQTITVMAVVQTPSGPLSSSQTIVLPDLRTLTPTVTFSSTPTLTRTPTATPTRTPTATPPAAHIQIALFVNQASSNGDGTLSSVISALVTDANGAVVGNGVPVAFSVVAPVVAGVSVTSPGLVGQAAPCTLSFTVTAQPGDALSCVKYDSARQGQTITVMAVVQTPSGPLSSTQTIVLPDLRTLTPTATFSSTPTLTRTPTSTSTQTATPTLPAAHIQVALFVNQASVNGDGTLSSVISALVTDANGAVVGNGVPVAFSIVAPVPAGVSVTSPGLVGQAAPCTLSFTVVAQPGDALSCVKYDTARQGQTITVMAVVQTPSGPLSSSQTIVLPDLRTLTPTMTLAATATPTLTITPTWTRTLTPTQTATPTPAAAHIQIALFVNQASVNGDGTLSSVISALVTDANGAVVGNGVPVQFSIVAPVPAGVSVTSPGLVGQAAPCTLSFTVVPQPGDALSCVKYDTARQGQTITVMAVVQTPSGPLSSSQTIILPDLRTPTPTLTFSATPTLVQSPPPTPTPSPTVTPTLQPSSIEFVSAEPVNIGVRQSGLPEHSTVTFRVIDPANHPVANVHVFFQLTAIGGESLSVLDAYTDALGLVQTVLASGTRAAPVRVGAGADIDGDNVPDVFVLSTPIAVLGGPPAQNRFSIAPQKVNIHGRRVFGLMDPISAFVNDRFGNAVPPGTAVSFVSNGASVVNPTTTDANGVAVATLVSEQNIPPSGIVTVLAFTRGEEAFHDTNGDGVFQAGIDDIVNDNQPEPYIDYRPLPPVLASVPPDDSACPIAPPSNLCNDQFDSTAQFELFVDADFNGVWNTQGTLGVWDTNILVFDAVPVTFSGPLVTPFATPSTFTIPNASSQSFTLEVHDDLRNPLVEGSTIQLNSTAGTIVPSTIVLVDGQSFNQLVPNLTQFEFRLVDDAPSTTSARPATISVTVTSPNGGGTFFVASGTVN